jgi:hypothetical protein
VNPRERDALLFIARVEYRRHTIKIVRRGNQIKLLIHRPDSPLATEMVTDALTNYEKALQDARQLIDRLVDGGEGR